MSVPLSVFTDAGFSAADAKSTKKKFDEQEIMLEMLTNGDVTQVRACRVPLRRAAVYVSPWPGTGIGRRCAGSAGSCSLCSIGAAPSSCRGAPCASSCSAQTCRRAQDMLRDEFGIKQLGKRLKVLEAAKTAMKDAPAQPKKKKAAAPKGAGAGETLRNRKGGGGETKRPPQPVTIAEPQRKKPSGPDRRSMKQKIADPKTVAEINAMRGVPVQLSDFFARTLGGARDIVGVATILMCLGYWGATALDVLPPGYDLLPPNTPAL